MKPISVSLSGGAAKCAYQGGLLFELHQLGYEFKHIEAISGGVISGHFAALGQAGYLEELWLEDIPAWMGKKRWLWEVPLNLLRGRRGLISPEFITGLSDWAITKIPGNLAFYVTSLTTGNTVRVWGDNFENVKEYRKGLYAACAIPVVFPPLPEMKTKRLSHYDAADGGIAFHLGDMDVDLRVSTATGYSRFDKTKGPLSILIRAAEIRAENFRVTNAPRAWVPMEPLPSSWNWSKSALKESFDLGKKDAYYVRDLLKQRNGL